MSGRTHGREEEGGALCEGEGEGQPVHAVRLRRRQVRAVPAEGEAQKEHRQTEGFKGKHRERCKAEQENAHLRQHGMDRTESFGMWAMTIQAAMAMFHQNVRTIVRIQGENEQ